MKLIMMIVIALIADESDLKGIETKPVPINL